MTGSSAAAEDPLAHIAGALLDGQRRVEHALPWIPDVCGLEAIWAHVPRSRAARRRRRQGIDGE